MGPMSLQFEEKFARRVERVPSEIRELTTLACREISTHGVVAPRATQTILLRESQGRATVR
jgi:hypothetical protein